MLNFELKINNVKTIHEIQGYWTNDDYISLLEEFNYSDAKNSNPAELRDLLEMAINDYEANEAAEILLKYKLKEVLSDGQIQHLSHEMAEDNESEEYPDISLHYPLFNINQLLHKSYNGIFPNAKATKMEIELRFEKIAEAEVTKEMVLKAISTVINGNNLIIRLFEDQLNGEEPFLEADQIIWELHNGGQNKYTVITSDYWINREDIMTSESTGSIKKVEHQKEE